MQQLNKQQMAMLAKRREEDYNEQLQQVREIELKARFWRAQWEIRHFTLEAEKLQVPYDEYVEAQRAKNEKAMKEYQEMLAKLSEEQKLKADEHGNTEQPEDIAMAPLVPETIIDKFN